MTEALSHGYSSESTQQSYHMNTNMTELRCVFFKWLRPCAFDESSLSIKRVNV